MIAIVRLADASLIGVNADHVLTIKANAADTQTQIDMITGPSIIALGSLITIAKSLNLSVVQTGQPSSQGTTPA